MSGDGGDSRVLEIRYAPYIESKHQAFLDIVVAYRESLVGSSPFSSYVDLDIDPAFFGIGYILSDFPSLYDMYGKFMAGLDIEVLFNQSFENTVNGLVIRDLVSEEAADLSDDLENVAFPRFEAGMRDINSVLSSTFIVGKAMMETARTRAISKFSAQMRYAMIPHAIERWKTHLEWNKGVITLYTEIIKLYIAGKLDVDSHNYKIAEMNVLWPFTVIEYERAAIGAMQGATNTKQPGASNTQRAVGGALSGAAAGAMIGGPPGALIGGALGLASAFL